MCCVTRQLCSWWSAADSYGLAIYFEKCIFRHCCIHMLPCNHNLFAPYQILQSCWVLFLAHAVLFTESSSENGDVIKIQTISSVWLWNIVMVCDQITAEASALLIHILVHTHIGARLGAVPKVIWFTEVLLLSASAVWFAKLLRTCHT